MGYLTLVKNRSVNTVHSYRLDAELLYRFATTGKLGQPRLKAPPEESVFDWAAVSEKMAIDYVHALKKSGAKDTSVFRKICSLKQLFKFLRRKRIVMDDPFLDFEMHAIRRKLPATLTIHEMNILLNRIRAPAGVKDLFVFFEMNQGEPQESQSRIDYKLARQIAG